MILVKRYQRERAVLYARTWALRRNPLFQDFSEQGGNCTNFVSQCILAGSCTMNYTKDFGWYYVNNSDRAPAWSGVEYFYDFMTGIPSFSTRNGGIGPYAVEVMPSTVVPGDVIQFANLDGVWYHSVIISAIANGEIYVCAHSQDSLDRPLSSYQYANLRFLHIAGVRFDSEAENEDCFEDLIIGGEIPGEEGPGEIPVPPPPFSPAPVPPEEEIPEETPPEEEPLPEEETPPEEEPLIPPESLLPVTEEEPESELPPDLPPPDVDRGD